MSSTRAPNRWSVSFPGLFRAGVWVWTVGAIAVIVLRLVAHDWHMLLIWANSYSLYLYAPAIVVLPFALWRRRRGLAAASGMVLVAALYWVGPDFWPGGELSAEAVTAPRLRVFSANLYKANDEVESLVEEIREANPDVVVLQEYSGRWADGLATHGLLQQFPHQLFRARNDAFGIAVLSKLSLEDRQLWRVGEVPMATVTVRVQGWPVQILAWHPLPPASPQYVRVWHNQYAALLAKVSKQPGTLLVIGDFNATQHAGCMQELRDRGFRSAHVERGRGWAVTFPNNTRLFPPPIRIDHALYRGRLECVSIREGHGLGSDHRPIVAEFAVLPLPGR